VLVVKRKGVTEVLVKIHRWEVTGVMRGSFTGTDFVARMLSVGVSREGVLCAEYFATDVAFELVIYAGVHIGNVFAHVTSVANVFAAIRAAWISRIF